MFVLNTFLDHKLFVGAIILIILINLGCILYLVIKERKKDREEIDDLVTSLSKAKPREVEEVKKEEVETPLNKGALEIEKVLEKMQKDLEATPEEVVNNFEKEQEEKSIISYQELVSSLKKEEPVKEEIVQTLTQDMKNIKDDVDVIDIEDEIVVKKVEPKEEIEEKEEIKNEVYQKKFKSTDFISPIFGKVDSIKDADYPTVPQFSREEKLEELLEDVPMKMTRTMKNNLEETLDIEPLQEEIRKNDEFLRSLKNFRSNL